MNFNNLGQTGLMVSEIGLGTWALSGVGYGPTDDKESLATIHAALDSGINFIDTADSYGMGHGENLVGKVLSERGDKDTIIATKFGWDFYNKKGIKGNLEKGYINFAINNSLKRLKRECIDIYQVHSQKPENIRRFKVIDTLEELKTEGKLRYYGISTSYINDADFILKNYSIDTLQFKYNLLCPITSDNIFDENLISKTGLISREPLANGFLSGRYGIDSMFPKTDHRNGLSKKEISDIIEKVDKFRFLETDSRTLAQASVNYCQLNNAIDVTLIGPKNRFQLNQLINSDYDKLTKNDMERINFKRADWI